MEIEGNSVQYELACPGWIDLQAASIQVRDVMYTEWNGWGTLVSDKARLKIQGLELYSSGFIFMSSPLLSNVRHIPAGVPHPAVVSSAKRRMLPNTLWRRCKS